MKKSHEKVERLKEGENATNQDFLCTIIFIQTEFIRIMKKVLLFQKNMKRQQDMQINMKYFPKHFLIFFF